MTVKPPFWFAGIDLDPSPYLKLHDAMLDASLDPDRFNQIDEIIIEEIAERIGTDFNTAMMWWTWYSLAARPEA